jgi:hypothetical protein
MPQDFEIDPDDQGTYKIRWSKWLPDGETIATSTWTVDDGLTKVSDNITDDNKSTTITVTGGTAGQVYEAHNQIEYGSDGDKETKTLTFAVVEK